MPLAAGRLRHKVRIEAPFVEEDPAGSSRVVWRTVADKVNAAIEPLSAREFIAAQQVQSQVIGKIIIRYRPGIDARMRIVHRSRIYNIAGTLPDPVSGREYLTIPVSEGVNAG